ncbi:MAG: hypothetical protein B7Z52_01060 [Burkholderiales bacterium 12-64-5]|nr:MAG: hypothetical protein B7Z52_01060 [Burkholderiales bacterium 12-64-5]
MARFGIPLIATPSQRLTVQLGQQSCVIAVRQRRTGLYLDLYVQNVAIVTGAAALNLVKIVREAYLGFTGDLFFVDTQGSNAPDFTGLGGRYVLVWDDTL